jgi:hypothetical protein
MKLITMKKNGKYRRKKRKEKDGTGQLEEEMQNFDLRKQNSIINGEHMIRNLN